MEIEPHQLSVCPTKEFGDINNVHETEEIYLIFACNFILLPYTTTGGEVGSAK